MAKILINTPEKAKKFVETAEKIPYDIDLCANSRSVIDGKSFLGVMSLDLSKPIEVEIHADEEERQEAYQELDEWTLE